MKYIRTNYLFGEIISHTKLINGTHLISIKDLDEILPISDGDLEKCKISDTIEELCDDFLLVNWKEHEKPLLCNYQKEKNAIYYIDEHGLNMLYVPNLLKSKIVIYGAIWTPKGLIYKAKMKGVLPNGEIDWELL